LDNTPCHAESGAYFAQHERISGRLNNPKHIKSLAEFLGQVFSGPVTRWAKTLLAFIETPEWSVSLVTEGIIYVPKNSTI